MAVDPQDVEIARCNLQHELDNLFPNQAGDVASLVAALEYFLNVREALKQCK